MSMRKEVRGSQEVFCSWLVHPLDVILYPDLDIELYSATRPGGRNELFEGEIGEGNLQHPVHGIISRLDLLDRDYRMVGGNTSLNRLELSKVTEAANFISNKGGNKLAINNNVVDTL